MTRRISDILFADAARSLVLIDHDGRRLDHRAFCDLVETVTSQLATLDVSGGDRVLLVAENSALYAASIFAVNRLDAWAVLLNARQTAPEIEAVATHAAPKLTLFLTAGSEAAARHAQCAQAAVHAETSYGPLVVKRGAGEPEPVAPGAADRVAALLYTSGTTGTPRGVMLTNANILWNAATSAELRLMTANDEMVGVLPGTHVFGFASTLMSAILVGSTLRLVPRFSPEAVLSAFADGATMMNAVPQMYQRLLEHCRGVPPDAPRLRYLAAGGAPLDPDVKARTEALFGLPLNNGYGITECSPGIAATRPLSPRQDVSVGPALDGVEVRIDQPDKNGVGELLVKSGGVMKGYYRDPEATARVFTDGFFRTGDLAKIGTDGAITIMGRTKELIIRSGFNVYPPEVEAALTAHPAIEEAAVVGRPGNGGNEEVVAFVRASHRLPGSLGLPGDLADHLSARLAAYKRPQHIILINAFPVAATGKVLKHRLLQEFAAHIPSESLTP
ncbi:MAG: class I adenylate-forming enzyme family protein [Pseudomonadota bacterium]